MSGYLHPTNTSGWPNAGLILGWCRRRWPNINPALGQRLVFVEWALFSLWDVYRYRPEITLLQQCRLLLSQSTRHTELMLVQCLTIFRNAGTTLSQHCVQFIYLVDSSRKYKRCTFFVRYGTYLLDECYMFPYHSQINTGWSIVWVEITKKYVNCHVISNLLL